MTFEHRASGKVILLGEHAVVYGVPALVAGIDRGALARATPAPTDRIRFGTTELASEHELFRALAALREAFGLGPVLLELQLELPAGSGLGASAALGVAAARALAALRPVGTSERQLLDAVDAWERVFHGNPSGVDAAAAQSGGILRFVRGNAPEPLLLRHGFVIAIALAGPPAATKEMVDGVARIRARKPEAFEQTLAAITALVDNAIQCLRAGDATGLGRLLDLNQMLLASWMVSTPGIELACSTARASGALGAKLTGSGGGGAVIALSSGDPERILSAWRSEGLECFACEIGNRGHS